MLNLQDRARRKGKDVRPDSKFTGRKRKDKFWSKTCDFFMIERELYLSHTSIQIHTDFFQYPVSEIGIADQLFSAPLLGGDWDLNSNHFYTCQCKICRTERGVAVTLTNNWCHAQKKCVPNSRHTDDLSGAAPLKNAIKSALMEWNGNVGRVTRIKREQLMK